jgi:hypothetical protein
MTKRRQSSIMPLNSEVDLFLRAVGFVLTGSDDADQNVIGDRTNCVFAIDQNVYRLNNVHTDRIMIPIHFYEGLEPLLATLAEKVIAPAEGKVKALAERRLMIEAELTKPQ